MIAVGDGAFADKETEKIITAFQSCFDFRIGDTAFFDQGQGDHQSKSLLIDGTITTEVAM